MRETLSSTPDIACHGLARLVYYTNYRHAFSPNSTNNPSPQNHKLAYQYILTTCPNYIPGPPTTVSKTKIPQKHQKIYFKKNVAIVYIRCPPSLTSASRCLLQTVHERRRTLFGVPAFRYPASFYSTSPSCGCPPLYFPLQPLQKLRTQLCHIASYNLLQHAKRNGFRFFFFSGNKKHNYHHLRTPASLRTTRAVSPVGLPPKRHTVQNTDHDSARSPAGRGHLASQRVAALVYPTKAPGKSRGGERRQRQHDTAVW